MNLKTSDALRVFLDKNPDKRPDLVAFTQAGDARIPSWLRGNGPIGLYLIRLRVYLTEQGMKPAEWTHLDPGLLTLARIISHDIITDDAAAKDIGTVKQNLFSALLGKRGLSDEKKETVQALNELYGPNLTTLKDSVTTEAPRGMSSKQIVVGERITLDQDAALLWLASCITLVLPIAQYLASDKCSPEQRNAFRKQVGPKVLFDATNGLNALTSETARGMMKRR